MRPAPSAGIGAHLPTSKVLSVRVLMCLGARGGEEREQEEGTLLTQGPSVSPSLAYIPLIVSLAREIRAWVAAGGFFAPIGTYMSFIELVWPEHLPIC